MHLAKIFNVDGCGVVPVVYGTPPQPPRCVGHSRQDILKGIHKSYRMCFCFEKFGIWRKKKQLLVYGTLCHARDTAKDAKHERKGSAVEWKSS